MTARDADKPHVPAWQAAASPAETGVITRTVGRLRWQLRPRTPPGAWSSLLEHPDAFLADPTKRLKSGDARLATLGVITLPESEPPLLLRRLNYGRLLHRLRDFCRDTRAERAFKHGLAMERAGIPTPRVLAAGLERRAGWPVRAYLITEYVTRARTLQELIAAPGGLSPRQCAQLVDLVAQLHDAGFSNRDLKATNLLCDERDDFCFVDLDGVRQHHRVPLGRVAKDLERLARNFPAAELARGARWWLKRYCRKRGLQGAFRILYKRALRRRAARLRKQPSGPA